MKKICWVTPDYFVDSDNHPTLATDKTCTGCLACVDICPTKALSDTVNKDGHLTYTCDTDKCILCHQCERVCPVVSDYQYQKQGTSKFYAAWCKDDKLRKRSSSGGAFAAMATYVINQGGYVVGASNEGICNIKHVVISDVSELNKLQGSKYMQSNAAESYKATFGLLKEGHIVLFSGTGCQVAGLLSFLKRKKYTGKLITVDLVCGGVPSRLLATKFIENEPYEVKKILSFRSKDGGWKSTGFIYNLQTEDGNGNVHDYTGIKNLLTDGFSREMTERYSCYDCNFNGENRASDFTIGDLWGDKQFPEQHKDGLSLIIAHNEHADLLLNEMATLLHSEEVDGESAIEHNPRIDNGHNVRGKLFERRHLSWLFDKLSYANLKHIYANDIKSYSPWIVYKIFRKIRIEILKKIAK